MKLIRFLQDGRARLGAVAGDYVIETEEAMRRFAPSSRRDAHPVISDMADYLAAGEEGRAALHEAVRQASQRTGLDGNGVYPLGMIRPIPPVNPGKIICAGLNYRDHCVEQNIPVPDRLITFAKYPSAVVGPGEPIRWTPEASSQVDYEAELAVVIGRETSRVSEDGALACVAGYLNLNDVSARDVQFVEKQWTRAKSFDTFCPIGPYLVTRQEIADPHNLAVECRLNGKVMQRSNTCELVFRIPFIISFLSQSITLVPGDIISTGTPGGVGVFREPKVFLKPGDVVEVEIEGLGCLRNPVA